MLNGRCQPYAQVEQYREERIAITTRADARPRAAHTREHAGWRSRTRRRECARERDVIPIRRSEPVVGAEHRRLDTAARRRPGVTSVLADLGCIHRQQAEAGA